MQHHDKIARVNFMITSTKFYVPVVTFSINDNMRYLESIKQAFKRTTSWNKYRSELAAQPKNNNFHYLVDPTIRNINRLFVLSFKNGNNDPARDSFNEYYMPLVEMKSLDALVENKSIFNQPVKNKQEAYEKLNEMLKNNDYATGKIFRLFVPSK